MSTKALVKELDQIVDKYHGSAPDLGNAMGAYVLGHHYGWKPLLLMYSRGSIKKYEQILGIKFKDKLPEEGPLVKRHKGYMFLKKAGDYWDTIRTGKAIKNAKVI